MDENLKLVCLANIYLINVAVLLTEEEEQFKKKKKYSAKWLLRREEEGFTHKLLKEIQCEDTKLYKNILRMTPVQFEKIVEIVGPLITKQNTEFRQCIGPAERLHVALRFLATGETQTSLQLPFRIQQSTISKILKETIPAIYQALNGEYLKFPQNENDWLQIAEEFYKQWGFPNCLGAIDGKHCKIRPMRKAGSTYFNYKREHSFVLMGIADANYRFIYADVGANGRVGDAGVWLRSDLKYAIEKKEVHIPTENNLPGTRTVCPYTFISDDGFGLTDYMMKPYSKINLSPSEQLFNYIYAIQKSSGS